MLKVKVSFKSSGLFPVLGKNVESGEGLVIVILSLLAQAGGAKDLKCPRPWPLPTLGSPETEEPNQ